MRHYISSCTSSRSAGVSLLACRGQRTTDTPADFTFYFEVCVQRTATYHVPARNTATTRRRRTSIYFPSKNIVQKKKKKIPVFIIIIRRYARCA